MKSAALTQAQPRRYPAHPPKLPVTRRCPHCIPTRGPTPSRLPPSLRLAPRPQAVGSQKFRPARRRAIPDSPPGTAAPDTRGGDPSEHRAQLDGARTGPASHRSPVPEGAAHTAPSPFSLSPREAFAAKRRGWRRGGSSLPQLSPTPGKATAAYRLRHP